jgi:Type I phosphodiesterase / nucleotide pyrophosphatase
MSHTDTVMQKAVVLWLSGTRLADMRVLPEVETLIERGVIVELDPSPITGPQSQHYQVFSGKSPSTFGFFDTFNPRNYAVTEESSGRGTTPALLPDQLRAVGWTVSYQETTPSELVSSVRSMTESDPGAIKQAPTCLIVKCEMHAVRDAEATAIGQALKVARKWVGEDGLLALLSDTQPAPVKHFVNMNNFLADMEMIERDEQSGEVNWLNSLAYFAGNGQLMVNLLGRDAQGAVHPQDEYEEVRDSLIKALPGKLRNPQNGEAVIERVYRKEELYAGDYLFCAPDLVVVFKPDYAPSESSKRIGFDETTFIAAAGETALAGVNPSTAGGFLIATAPSLAERVTEYEHAPLTAVAPTLLHALGVEYVDMESSAIATLFAPEYLETHPIRATSQQQELSEEDEELIISHLRDLGYV